MQEIVFITDTNTSEAWGLQHMVGLCLAAREIGVQGLDEGSRDGIHLPATRFDQVVI